MSEVPESIRCEAYGPGGAALLVDCRTDNRDRTVAQVRQILRKHGGYMAAVGAVSYLFNEVGSLKFPPATDAVRLTEAALTAGAEEVIAAPLEVLADPIELEALRAALLASGFAAASAEVMLRASITVSLTGEAARAMLNLIDTLRDLRDVENVYTNAEISDEVVARF